MDDQERDSDQAWEATYARRPWWRRFSMRWETVVAYVIASAGFVVGVWAVDHNAQEKIARVEADAQSLEDRQELFVRVDELVARMCDYFDGSPARLRALVESLSEDASPEKRAVVLAKFDEQYPPGETACDEAP